MRKILECYNNYKAVNRMDVKQKDLNNEESKSGERE
jgi:hypothetical protein